MWWVGATIEREEKHYHLNFLDLFYPFVLKTKLEAIRKYYGIKEWDEDNIFNINHFIRCCEFLTYNNKAVTQNEIFPSYKHLIFEGSQGILLGQDSGFFPNVTRSDTGSKRVCEFNPAYYLVTRAYQTRHGNGPMSNVEYPHNILSNPNETNVTNEWQGNFRRTLLDVDMLEYAIRKDGIDIGEAMLCITCLEQIKNEYRFTYGNRIVNCDDENDFVFQIWNILHPKDIYCFKMEDGKITSKPFLRGVNRW